MADVKDVKCAYWDSPIEAGDTCRVAVQFQYQGPSTTKRVYAAIGNVIGWVFDEKVAAYKDLNIPASYPAGSWNSYTTYVNIPITAALAAAGGPFDLFGKVRIAWIGWEESPYYHDVIHIGGFIPEANYRDLRISSFWPTELSIGNTLEIKFRIDHIGKAQTGTLHVAVGKQNTWFNEEPGMTKDFSVQFPAEEDWNTWTITARIPCQNIDPGKYEFYAVLRHVTGADRYVYSDQDVLTVAGGYEAEITSVQLDIAGVSILGEWKDIPVDDITKDTRTRVKVVTHNCGPLPYHVNCLWEVRGPDGNLVSNGQYNNTAIDLASPCESTEFFPLNKNITLHDPGEYTIEIWIRESDTGSTLLHQKATRLCTVFEQEELEDGKIIKKTLEISGVSPNPTIPVAAEVALWANAKVHVFGRNTGDIPFHASCSWEVRGPDGSLVKAYESTSNEWISPGEEVHFYEIWETFSLAEVGNYTIKIELSSLETGKLLGDYEGRLCTVEEIIECSVNADCPPGYSCVDGQCIKEFEPECTVLGERKCVHGNLYECTEGPQRWFWMLIEEDSPECAVDGKTPWGWIALGVGAAILLATGKKKPAKKENKNV